MAAINGINKTTVSVRKPVAPRPKVVKAVEVAPEKPMSDEELATLICGGVKVYTNQLLHYLQTELSTLQGSFDSVSGKPWDREGLIGHYIFHYMQNRKDHPLFVAEMARREKFKLEKERELEELKKNFNPTLQEKLDKLKRWNILGTPHARNAESGFATCCGMHNARSTSIANRMFWEFVKEEEKPSVRHHTQQVNIADAALRGSLLISWEDA